MSLVASCSSCLTRHPDVAKISSTGGGPTGKRIAANAADRLVPVSLELGGKSPNIVFEDADLNRAIVGAVAGIFGAAGQTCVAGSRLLVQRSVYDRVLSEVSARAGRVRLGDPKSTGTEMGPVANQPQYDRILGMMAAAQESGERVTAGGGAASGDDLGDGLFVQPTVLADVDPDSAIAHEEVFGPVLAVIPFDTEEDAVRIANGTEFGLAAGVWTSDVSRSFRMTAALDAGVIRVNTYRTSAAQAPFGGIKQSGYGRERGEDALADYTYVKNVMVDTSTAARRTGGRGVGARAGGREQGAARRQQPLHGRHLPHDARRPRGHQAGAAQRQCSRTRRAATRTCTPCSSTVTAGASSTRARTTSS
ncbi:MAG: aldehyde dehydrogenase family protein [Microbacteriaceae bacterium]|nr:MAG: aldehyde dehydrogenase family protein [Microbacteriaceae bacterium]